MQAHIPEERKILIRQLEVQLENFWKCRIIETAPIHGWEIAIAGPGQPPARAPKTGWKPYELGSHWGEDQAGFTAWFRAKAAVPKGYAQPGTFVELFLDPAREALVYINGAPFQGLSENHSTIRLQKKDLLEKSFELAIEAYTEHPRDPSPVYYGRFRHAEIQLIDKAIYDFWWDCHTALEVAKVLDQNGQPFQKLLGHLLDAMKAVLPVSKVPGELRRKAIQAAKKLKKELEALPSEPGRGKLVFTGHSHIDTAWLWTLQETQRKCGRTFSTVLSLMNTYPEYSFSQSQPQLYQYTKEHYPEIYAEIKKRVREGRWDPAGAPWVEMDSNVSGGEALVRQMLYGNLFFEEEFGVRSNICWLPDAFGYNWNLPQILKKSGIDLFVTTKISWSEVTKFPYSIFNWEGADGTTVIGLMPPLNYNGMMTARDLREHWDLIQQKNCIEEMVYSFGYGDGGGGPTREMLEFGKRVANITGIPQSRFGTASEYAHELLASLDTARLPTWNGELYLELHRGCQTTQSRTKRNNRKSEALLREAEMVSSLAFLAGKKYPGDALLKAWRTVLTNQFHDILPGSSVKEVYADADRDYAAVQETVSGLRKEAGAFLAKKIQVKGEGSPVLLFNSLNWTPTAPVALETELPEGGVCLVDGDGNALDCQKTVDSQGQGSLLIAPNGLPCFGSQVVWMRKGGAATASTLKASKSLLENDFYKISLDAKGLISSLFDKRARREVLAPGCKGNALQLFHDEPHCWDAWDVDFNFDENMWEWNDLQSIEPIENGPLRAGVRLVRKAGSSTLCQNIFIYRDSPRIDFVTEADWHERLVMLKAAFPVNVRSSNAAYEIQFGAIERSTHRNTPYDRARFEVPHLRWMDLSEGDYGVALANDCKYGADISGNALRLSLLRSPTAPDCLADEGLHRFTYSLIPHQGDWRAGEVVRHAYELNSPTCAMPVQKGNGEVADRQSWICIDSKNVILEALKKCEKSDALILRLYECHGTRGPVRISFGFPVKKVWECNLMEEQDQPLKLSKGETALNIAPFEIKTLKIEAE